MNYLVVGGGSGIGEKVVEKLTLAGHQVFAASRNIADANLPPGVEPIIFNVMEDDSLEGLPDVLDGLVYCPGSINLKPFHRIKAADFQAEWELNFMGAVKVTQQVLGLLKKSENPSVVYFSTVAVQLGLPFHSSISASKGAIEGLTRSLAAEYAPKIRFNAIAPSLTDTPLAASLLSNDKKREANAERNPLKLIGEAQDIANMCSFLLSQESRWMTGQILAVDGGMGSIRPM
jgi:NAD(P)-dependent dehydrogenase (short-subunit alcohol dehydrogenase family)